MIYSTTSDLTRQICATIGARFEAGFVETARRGDKILVRGTGGKPQDFRWLADQCDAHGYAFRLDNALRAALARSGVKFPRPTPLTSAERADYAAEWTAFEAAERL